MMRKDHFKQKLLLWHQVSFKQFLKFKYLVLHCITTVFSISVKIHKIFINFSKFIFFKYTIKEDNLRSSRLISLNTLSVICDLSFSIKDNAILFFFYTTVIYVHACNSSLHQIQGLSSPTAGGFLKFSAVITLINLPWLPWKLNWNQI